MKFIVNSRGLIYPYTVSFFLLPHYKFSAKTTGLPFVNILNYSDEKYLKFCWNKEKIENFGKKLLKECSNRQKKEQHFKKMKIYSDLAIKRSEMLLGKNFKKLSDKDLEGVCNYIEKEIFPFESFFNVDIDAFDIVFENFLKEKISKELAGYNDEKISEIYSLVSIPIGETYINKEEKAIISEALYSKNINKSAEILTHNFWWTNLGWENMIPYKPSHFISKINRYSKKEDLEGKLKAMEKQLLERRKERTKIIKKYKLSKGISYWLSFLDKYVYYHDRRKEMQMKCAYAGWLILNEVSRRTGFKKEDLSWLFGFQEIKDILKGKSLDMAEIGKRKKGFLISVNQKSFKKISGTNTTIIFKREVNESIRNIKEFEGTVAMRGVARGSARVCDGYQDAVKKIKNKKDILVCGMTTPEYVIAMRKAGAVITDEGGLTCHASIISRELKVPCIIGTKIATKVLKDGDVLEVDANKGMIKISN